MAISQARQKELRLMALTIVWQVIDRATREVDLEVSYEELKFVGEVIEHKARKAFTDRNKHADLIKERLKA